MEPHERPANLESSWAPIEVRLAGCAVDLAAFFLLLGVLLGAASAIHVDWGSAGNWYLLLALTLCYEIGLVAIGLTPGNWLCGMSIVDADGRAPGVARAFKRGLVPGVPWILVVFTAPMWGSVRAEWPSTAGAAITVAIGLTIVSVLGTTGNAPRSGSEKSSGVRMLQDHLAGTFVLAQPRPAIPLAGWVSQAGADLLERYRQLARWVSCARADLLARYRQFRADVGAAWSRTQWEPQPPARVQEPVDADLRRAVALLIDLGLLVLAKDWAEETNLPFAHQDSWYFLVIVFAVVNLILLPSYGASIGKWLTGVRIVDAEYRPPGLHSALVRGLFPGAVWVALLLAAPQRVALGGANWTEVLLWGVLVVTMFATLIDGITYFSEPYQRAMHDLAAGTYVVQTSRLVEVGARPRRTIVATQPASWPIVGPVGDLLGRWKTEKSSAAWKPRLLTRRIVGFVCDSLILAVCLAVISLPLAGYEHHDDRLVAKAALMIGFLVGFVALGATPGTWLAGLEIVSARASKPPGWWRAIRRLPLFAPFLLLIAFDSTRMAFHMEASEPAMIAADFLLVTQILIVLADVFMLARHGEALHDTVAGTRVVRSSPTSFRALMTDPGICHSPGRDPSDAAGAFLAKWRPHLAESGKAHTSTDER